MELRSRHLPHWGVLKIGYAVYRESRFSTTAARPIR
jgi:hypothetical protein